MKKVLIATPAFGGQINSIYVESVLRVCTALKSIGWDWEFYCISNESLITRARNACASYALANKFDKLFFIDADIGFTPADFGNVLNNSNLISSGMTPLKGIPMRLNFRTLPDHVEQDQRIVEVQHVGTSFLCIDTKVLKQMVDAGTVDSYEHRGAINYDFFQVGVGDGEYLSEDFYFCREARKLGNKIIVDRNVALKHAGTFVFDPVQLNHITELMQRDMLTLVKG